MNTKKTLLLAGAIAVSFMLGSYAKAADIAASPRLQQMLNERKSVSSTDTRPNLVSANYLGAAAKWELNRAKVVPSGTITPNLVSGNYAGAAARNQYPSRAQFELAPLAKPGK